ncbi:hypothetical protein BDN67DRAFT_476349 [Paxillus ammoniavirescens]|nr:hypothetical protein BDN67DRAFT_476349 [Paxillus ammoniavirescens]
MSLVIWIAIFVKFLEALKVYMDDSYSYELLGKLLYYAPYDTWYPAKQTLLLQLWDEIGLPHDKSKQVFGDTLEVIGFIVDPNAMSVTFPAAKKTELIHHLRKFVIPRKRWTLHKYQQLAGWVNWGLNVFPYLRPGLSALYAKMSGKRKGFTCIRVNLQVISELQWIANHLERMEGILLFDSLHWSPETSRDALVVFTDASGKLGLGFFLPTLNTGYQCALPLSPPDNSIFFFEALAVCSVIHHVASMPSPPRRLAIYSDSTNTVDLFNSLRASHPYNNILISAIDVLLHNQIDFRVIHIDGSKNHVADALSHFNNAAAESHAPGIIINHFQPPRDALGASQK